MAAVTGRQPCSHDVSREGAEEGRWGGVGPAQATATVPSCTCPHDTHKHTHARAHTHAHTPTRVCTGTQQPGGRCPRWCRARPAEGATGQHWAHSAFCSLRALGSLGPAHFLLEAGGGTSPGNHVLGTKGPFMPHHSFISSGPRWCGSPCPGQNVPRGLTLLTTPKRWRLAAEDRGHSLLVRHDHGGLLGLWGVRGMGHL